MIRTRIQTELAMLRHPAFTDDARYDKLVKIHPSVKTYAIAYGHDRIIEDYLNTTSQICIFSGLTFDKIIKIITMKAEVLDVIGST